MDENAQYYKDIIEILAKLDEKLTDVADDLSVLKESLDQMREEFFNSPQEDD